MIRIGKLAGRDVRCVLTPMDQPLGYAIGNSLEVIEAIKFLKGDMPEDLKEVVLELGANMLQLAGKGSNLEENKIKMIENIQNGLAFEKFKEMVQNQGGDISYLENVDKFKKSKYISKIEATNSGKVTEINAEEVGKLACYLGAGRISKEDKIDSSVGIILNKKIGDKVTQNETLAYIFANDENKLKETEKRLLQIYKIV